MFLLPGEGFYGVADETNALSARNMTQKEIEEHQMRWARELAPQTEGVLSFASLQNYRLQDYRQTVPVVSVPAWYRDWSAEFSAVPVCNP